ncbi:hypothetical protein M011DRAFT_77497 [Sporormia fimetaria CBS 119925]|uniref:Uncharacterized protein n=1 Tax=Sporormia fimetaria CBS 119925 TaxID=1340428 RepID=A0A6A6VAZ3_9PLEO|nr:hypothetical protein M011DRAFT_77497 [Sporormia fimetaria CBS 119925]
MEPGYEASDSSQCVDPLGQESTPPSSEHGAGDGPSDPSQNTSVTAVDTDEEEIETHLKSNSTLCEAPPSEEPPQATGLQQPSVESVPECSSPSAPDPVSATYEDALPKEPDTQDSLGLITDTPSKPTLQSDETLSPSTPARVNATSEDALPEEPAGDVSTEGPTVSFQQPTPHINEAEGVQPAEGMPHVPDLNMDSTADALGLLSFACNLDLVVAQQIDYLDGLRSFLQPYLVQSGTRGYSAFERVNTGSANSRSRQARPPPRVDQKKPNPQGPPNETQISTSINTAKRKGKKKRSHKGSQIPQPKRMASLIDYVKPDQRATLEGSADGRPAGSTPVTSNAEPNHEQAKDAGDATSKENSQEPTDNFTKEDPPIQPINANNAASYSSIYPFSRLPTPSCNMLILGWLPEV